MISERDDGTRFCLYSFFFASIQKTQNKKYMVIRGTSPPEVNFQKIDAKKSHPKVAYLLKNSCPKMRVSV